MTDDEKRPERVLLIGSSRFKETFARVSYELETTGHLVLAMHFFQHADGFEVTPAQRELLAWVDRARIDLADRVLVINGKRGWCRGCKSWIDEFRNDCGCGPQVPDWEKTMNRRERPYVGEDTQKEIDYALASGKPLRYLEDPKP